MISLVHFPDVIFLKLICSIFSIELETVPRFCSSKLGRECEDRDLSCGRGSNDLARARVDPERCWDRSKEYWRAWIGYAKKEKIGFQSYTHTGTRENCQDERSSSFIRVCAASALLRYSMRARALHLHEEKRTTIELSIRDMIIMFVCCWVRRFSKAHLCHCRVLTPTWRYD